VEKTSVDTGQEDRFVCISEPLSFWSLHITTTHGIDEASSLGIIASSHLHMTSVFLRVVSNVSLVFFVLMQGRACEFHVRRCKNGVMP